jgi:hypothetical protein
MFDMSCRQIREHVENFQDRDLDLGSFPADVLAHLNLCAHCKLWLGHRRELALTLRRLRESAPEAPTSLDASVLQTFREHSSAPKRGSALHKTVNPGAILGLSAALLAMVILISLLPGRRAVPRIEPIRGKQPIARELPALASISTPPSAMKPASFQAHKKLGKYNPRQRAAIAENHSLHSGFTSLMYCDQLSCAGDMEIVRVQLSPSMLGLPPGQADSSIRADVLVGLDGIARGIRLEQ